MLELKPLEVVVDVNNRPVVVALPWVELVPVPPRRWTVVEHAGEQVRHSSRRYVVCPSCRERVPLAGTPSTLRCRRSQETFGVG